MKGGLGGFNDILRSILYALIVSLVLILIFSVVIKVFELSDSVIPPVTQIIKILSILIGVIMGIKDRTKVLKKCIIAGAFFSALSLALFSLITRGSVFEVKSLLEIALGALIGALSSIVFALVKK